MEASENEEEVGEFEDDREELVPSYDEVYEALEKLKNNKAAGSDGLPGELLKSAGGDFIKEFAHLIERIWLEEVMPDAVSYTHLLSEYHPIKFSLKIWMYGSTQGLATYHNKQFIL